MRRSPRPLAALSRFLRRSPARAGALALGLLVLGAVAVAETPAYQARLDALEAKATAARQRAGLDTSAACTQDPTPEMTFAKVIDVKVGHPFTVEVAGHVSKGTAFVFENDRVHVVHAAIHATGATITGRVDAGALPGTVELAAVGPLCGSQADAEAVRIVAPTEWRLDLDNGWKAVIDAKAFGGDGHDCTATWRGSGHTKTMPCALTEASGGGYHVALGTLEENQARMTKAMQTMSDPKVAKAQAAAQAEIEKMGVCTKETDEHQRIACMQAVGDKVQKLSDAVQKAQEDATRRALKDAFGCLALDLEVTGGKVAVQASSCGYPATHDGKGTVTVR